MSTEVKIPRHYPDFSRLAKFPDTSWYSHLANNLRGSCQLEYKKKLHCDRIHLKKVPRPATAFCLRHADWRLAPVHHFKVIP